MDLDATQWIGVILIVAGAVGYLTRYYRRQLRGGGGCASCGSLDQPAQPEQSATGGGATQFLPAENLADEAKRMKQGQDSARSQ